jgi:hypothetical protein
MNTAQLCNDTRWPISIDTEAGRVFLTKAEAEMLLHSLQVCLAELDQLENTK